MNEIIYTLFHPLSNAISSALVIVSLIYWIFSFLGVGLDDFDIEIGTGVSTDVHVDADVDIDADTDPDIDGDNSSSSHKEGGFIQFLKYINVGKVPFMFVSSILSFFTWLGSLLTTHFTSASNWGWKSILILIPCFLIAVFLTKYATSPVARFLKYAGYHGEEVHEFLGRSGKMLSSIEGKKVGIAEVIINKDPIRLNVISHSGEKINYGDTVMITDESDDKKIFYVTREITLDQH